VTRLKKNIVYNLLGYGLLFVVSLVSVRFIFRQLGKDVLGIIYFTAMLNALLASFSQMGTGTTIVREVAAHNKSEPDYVRDLIRTFSSCYWTGYVLLAIAIYFGAPYIVDNWIKLGSTDRKSAVFAIQILGIASIISLPRTLYGSLFRGIQRMEFNNIIEVSTAALQQFGIIVILSVHGTLSHVIFWYAGCYYLRILIFIVTSTKFFPARTLIPGFSWYAIKRNVDFGSKMMISALVSSIHRRFDQLTLSKFSTIGNLGYYNVALKPVRNVRSIAWAIAQAAYPNLAETHEQADRDTLMRKYHMLQDLICYGMVPLFACIPFAFIPLFSYILNKEIAHMLLLPCFILCLAFYLHTTAFIPHFFALALGKPDIPMRLNFYVFVISLPASVVLIYQLDLIGAALSLLVPRIIAYTYAVPRICKECLLISTLAWYKHILKILLLAVVIYGLAWTIIVLNHNYSVFNLLLTYLVSTLVFSIGAFYMAGDEMRVSILHNLQSVRGVFT
jgi:O-antigen/teichoic acid export membrane protein